MDTVQTNRGVYRKTDEIAKALDHDDACVIDSGNSELVGVLVKIFDYELQV
jgi:hypothetical protein